MPPKPEPRNLRVKLVVDLAGLVGLTSVSRGDRIRGFGEVARVDLTSGVVVLTATTGETARLIPGLGVVTETTEGET